MRALEMAGVLALICNGAALVGLAVLWVGERVSVSLRQRLPLKRR